MLQEMRKYTKSWIANIFLGVLTLSFVSWGVGDILRGRVSTAVATVGDSSIEQTEFQRDYTNALRNEGQQRGKSISADEARKAGLPMLLLNRSIDRLVLDNVARKLGITASDALVTQEIHAIPAFAGLTGQFDRQTFEQSISRIGYSEQGFIELVRQDTARGQLAHAIESGLEIPPGYARALFAYSTEIRAAQYIVVEDKSLGAIPPPPDAVLQAYIKAHADRFSTPEYRDVTYAWVGPDDVAAGITVTDDQIKSAYDNNVDRFITPEKRGLQQITFPSQDEAKAARAKIAAGTKFEQIAAARGEKPSDIELGELVAADLDPALSKAAFALPQDGVTQPLKAAAGWVLIRVVKIVPGKTTTLDQARDQIRKALVQETAQSKLTDIANAYTDASSGGLSLLEAAKKVGMHMAHIPAMDGDGLAPDGSKTAAPDDPDFRKQVFRTEPNEEGDPQPAKSGIYYVVAVNGILPPKLKPLDQVRAQALASWTAEQRAILLKQKAEQLTAQANREDSLDGAAKAIGAPVQSSPALNRGTTNADFSASLLTALFDAMPGKSVSGPRGTGHAYVVARVTGIVHPPIPANEPGFRTGLQELSENLGTGVTDSFVAAQKAKQGVTINTKLLNNVTGAEGS